MYFSPEEVRDFEGIERNLMSAFRGQFILFLIFGRKFLEHLTPSDEGFGSQRKLPNGKSVVYYRVSYSHAALKHYLGLGVQRDFVSTNASRNVTLPPPGNERDRVLIPVEWELKRPDE